MHGYALVFSITSRETFERIEPINEALLNALGDAQDVPRVLVGSMKDLAHQRQVSMQVGVGVRIVTVGAYRGFGSRYTNVFCCSPLLSYRDIQCFLLLTVTFLPSLHASTRLDSQRTHFCLYVVVICVAMVTW